MTLRFASTALLLFVAPAAMAHGLSSCKLTSFSTTGAFAAYDPFDNNFTPVPISLNARTTSGCNGGTIQFAIGPTPASPNTGTSSVALRSGGQTAVASILGPGGSALTISPPATAFTTGIQASLPLGTSGPLGGGSILKFAVPPGQAVPPGPYGALLRLLVRVTDKNGNVSDSSAALPLLLAVKPSVRLAAGSGSLHIDVGELKPGALGGPVRFDAYANMDYELFLISDNGFTLAPNGHGAPGSGVPYLPILSNQPVTQAVSSHGQGSARGLVFNAPGGGGRRQQTFSVKILPFANFPAGDYSDLLTLEIRAKV